MEGILVVDLQSDSTAAGSAVRMEVQKLRTDPRPFRRTTLGLPSLAQQTAGNV